MTNVNLPENLADIRRQIDELNVATLAYAGVGMTATEYYIALISGDDMILVKKRFRTDDAEAEIIHMLGKLASDNNIKIVAAQILSNEKQEVLGERMWLEEDIVPIFSVTKRINEDKIRAAALKTSGFFDEHGLVAVPIDEHQKVGVSWLIRKETYQKQVSDNVWQLLEKMIDEFRSYNTPIAYINATAQGGGVALMRHALLRFMREVDIPSSWYVMRPNSDVFEITKGKFHNVLQAVAPKGVILTERDKDIYNAWINENVEQLRDVFEKSNIIVIDDPQPSGLIPHIREINPNAKIIYRSHIQLDRDLIAQPNSPQQITWSFLWESIRQADLFVSHPVEKFIPYDAMPYTVTMPATTDPLDGLNKPLSDTQMAYHRKLFNKILLEHIQKPLDDTRPYFIQVARFDPSKGIPDVIESYRLLREKLEKDIPVPQLVLVGHSSIDDPDGVPVYNMTLRLLQEAKYRNVAQDVKVVRLHHNDQI